MRSYCRDQVQPDLGEPAQSRSGLVRPVVKVKGKLGVAAQVDQGAERAHELVGGHRIAAVGLFHHGVGELPQDPQPGTLAANLDALDLPIVFDKGLGPDRVAAREDRRADRRGQPAKLVQLCCGPEQVAGAVLPRLELGLGVGQDAADVNVLRRYSPLLAPDELDGVRRKVAAGKADHRPVVVALFPEGSLMVQPALHLGFHDLS